uniref:tRNA (32-2'-O)-methyltransferase regulator THADA n=1 Tax=Caenorhabditis tropicalis TaxID=1561998 RepID=A0A1I7T7S4_9PELO
MPVRVAGKAIRDLEYLHSKVIRTDLFEGEDPIIFNELRRTLEASEKYLSDNETVIFASATLKRILILILESRLPLPSRLAHKIILHIRRVWDYSAACVCHDAVDSFSIFLEIHLKTCTDCLERPANDSHANCDRINELTQWLLEPTSLCRSRFRCISHLLAQCPTLRLNFGEDFFRRTYPLLSNPSFSNVICELIVDNIFDREDLWNLHSELLLTSTDASLIRNRLIPLLQKHHSSNSSSPDKQKQEKLDDSDTAVKFLNQLLIQLNSKNPPSDLQSHLEIVHALIITTWPKKQTKDDQPANLVDFSNWSQCINEDTMTEAIVHVDSNVRLAAFKLVVENTRKTIPFNETDIEFIKTFLASNMPVQSPSSRQKLIATFKFMCQRLGASAEINLKQGQQKVEKESESLSPESSSFDHRGLAKWRLDRDTLDPLVETYIGLARWMAKLAFESLSPKANFYRRIMALMQIDVLFNKENFITDGKCRFANKLNLDSTLGSDRHKLVVDCLDDSYDLVQTTALGLLKKLDFGNVKMDEDKYLKEAIDLMSTTRSRNSTSAGFRMQYYLSRKPERYTSCLKRYLGDLKTRSEAVEKELMNITSLPIHPLLNMIELLLKNPSWEDSDEQKVKFYTDECLTELLPICHQIVSIVSPVVHSMSPEGCIPDEVLNDIFSWMIETIAPKKLMPIDQIEAIGSFYWTQLTECKHRGAFESATEGFTQLCQFLWTTTIEGLPKPKDWLDEILAALRGEKDLTNLCSTRRSAGLPHLVLAIVATEPKTNENHALITATESLLNMEGKSAEYRVHSMNVMKTIVQNSALHERAVFCYEKTLRVAIDACRADWSERNAASQLFAALRTKIFGVMRSAQRSLYVDQKNRKSNYEFFSKFPSLYQFLFDQVKLEQSEFSLLPPLLVLTHLYTPASSSELYPLRPFVPPLLEIALREKREDLRAHAIAAVLAISDSYANDDLCQWVELFDFQKARQNQIHSFMLLLDGLSNYAEYVNRIVAIVAKILNSLVFKTWSDFNINLLFTLSNKFFLEYDVDEVTVDQVCLAKRPLAAKLLRDRDAFKSEMSRLLRNEDTRREVYRLISNQGWNVCNMFLRAHIIGISIKDLASPDIQQCDAKRIMQILDATTDDFMSKENKQKTVEVIEQRLADENLNWTLPSTMAYATKLRYKNVTYPDDELIAWIRESFELDDPETKMIALNVGGSFVRRLPSKRSYTDPEKDLISAVLLYLQDESEYMRQQTSFYLSHFIRDVTHAAINPEICRLLIIKWCLNDGNENLDQFSSADKKK